MYKEKKNEKNDMDKLWQQFWMVTRIFMRWFMDTRGKVYVDLEV